MCLGGRSAALLVALGSIVRIAGGSASALDLRPSSGVTLPQDTPQSSAEPGSRGALATVRSPQIRGRLLTPDRRQLAHGSLVMTPEDSDGSTASTNGMMRPDGSFLFTGVPPGSYLIRALAQTELDGSLLFAVFRVTVRDRDLDGIDLVLRPGATISGRLVGDSSSGSLSDVLPRVRVRAPFDDGSSFGDAQTGEPRRDGTFAIQGVMAGAHLIVVEGLPAPWSLKTVRYRGQDITDVGVQADSGQRVDDVRITITDRGNDVSGTVRNGEERAVANARVLFVPVPAALWPVASRRFARSLTDATGHYNVRGLPAGDYRAAALLEVGDRDMYRDEIIRAVRNHGIAITLENAGMRVLDLKVGTPLQSRVATR
jgi:hypothetical protein